MRKKGSLINCYRNWGSKLFKNIYIDGNIKKVGEKQLEEEKNKK